MLKNFLSIMLLVLAFGNTTIAQTQASINNQFIIQLDETAELKPSYTFDISNLNFANEQEAIELFATASAHNVVSFTLNYPSNEVTLELNNSLLLAENRNAAFMNRMLKYYANYLRKLKNN